MTGVPKSLGCEACRKQKKRCDQAKPTCGRCKRLDITCVGSGVRRWMFKSENAKALTRQTADAPKPSPSNDKTRLASSWVFILDIDDIKYSVRPFGGTYLAELPRRIGTSLAFDETVSALAATYNALQNKEAKVKALSQYGNALKALRKSLQDPTVSTVTKIRTVYNIYVCQQWIDRKQGLSTKHREMLAHLFQESVWDGTVYELPPAHIYGLCQFVIWESMLNPKVSLGPWFWQISRSFDGARPHAYQKGHSFISLDLMIGAEIATFFGSPKHHIERIHCLYNLVQFERPRLSLMKEQMKAVAVAPQASPRTKSTYFAYQAGYAHMLVSGSLLNRLFRTFNRNPELVEESHELCDDAIVLAYECLSARPFGAAFVANLLVAVWGSLTDSYRYGELEALMAEYSTDFLGAEYLQEAMAIKDRLEKMKSGDATGDHASTPEGDGSQLVPRLPSTESSYF